MTQSNWHSWERFFSRRAGRAVPRLDVNDDYSSVPTSVARSLAIFQLGESGGGTIVQQSAGAELPGTNESFARSMAYFVGEENRHATLLAMCVRMLGGELKRKNWTATCFVKVRRLIGLRFKVLVLLAAEVVGLCYYQLLASRLPRGQVRAILRQIAADERGHLDFHCAFLRTQCDGPIAKAVFVVSWRVVMLGAALAVLIDHRRAVADLRIPLRRLWHVWWCYAMLAERTVLAPRSVLPPTVKTRPRREDQRTGECLLGQNPKRAPVPDAWYRRHSAAAFEANSDRFERAAHDWPGSGDSEEHGLQWRQAHTTRSSLSRASSCGDG